MSPKEASVTDLINQRVVLYSQIRSGSMGAHHIGLGNYELTTANKLGKGEKILSGKERMVPCQRLLNLS